MTDNTDPGRPTAAATADPAAAIPPRTTLIGDPAILDRPLLALFCSVTCPGDLILRLYDLARDLRDAGVPVVSGFHTPMERECLALLLRGAQPVVVCPARGIAGMRLPPAWKAPLATGRLLVLSPFPAETRRPTVALAGRRNALVTDLATQTLIAYARPGGATHRLAADLAAAGTPPRTLDHPANAHLLALGAAPFALADFSALSTRPRAVRATRGSPIR